MNTSKRRGRPPKNAVAPKKRGRPPKNTVTIKAVPKKRGRKSNAEKELEAIRFEHLQNVIKRLERDLESMSITVKNLKHQEIGYKALISYFEYQLGLKASQDDKRTPV